MTPPLPYDLRIGVTGHRTIANEPAVAAAVAALLVKGDASFTACVSFFDTRRSRMVQRGDGRVLLDHYSIRLNFNVTGFAIGPA